MNTNKPASNSKEMLKPHDNSVALDNMSPEQLLSEVTNLRRKYDELVSFSVNLTAERDILNNTLEQTKRELNRETGARASLENRTGDVAGGGSAVKSEKSSGLAPFTFLFISLLFFLIGVKATSSDSVGFLLNIPTVGEFLLLDPDNVQQEDVDVPEL